MVTSINTKDLINARTAETTPLDNAVNIPLANILKPIKRSAIVQILFPVTERSYTGLSGRANTDTSGSVNAQERTTVASEMAAITLRLMETSLFNFSWFFSP